MLFWRKKLLLSKIESSYGVDSSPAAATDAVLIQASDVTLTPLEAEELPRDVVRAGGEKGAFLRQLVGKHVVLEFSVEMAGSGTVDTPPAYGTLLRACGLAETINTTTSVQYDPVSESEESVSVYMHIDGVLHKLLGARGNVSLEFAVRQKPRYQFRLVGLFAAVTDVAFPSPTYANQQQPLPVSNENTPTATLHGTSILFSNLNADLGNAVVHDELVGSEEMIIEDREASGEVTIEAVTVATKDWFGAVTAETLDALQVVHGTVAGNIVQIDAPKVQLLSPRYDNRAGKAMLTMGLNLTPDSGDDELRITTQ